MTNTPRLLAAMQAGIKRVMKKNSLHFMKMIKVCLLMCVIAFQKVPGNAFQPPVEAQQRTRTNIGLDLHHQETRNNLRTRSNRQKSLLLLSSASSSLAIARRRQLNKDVVIIGGGLAGLSAALYLSQIDPDRHITILDKEDIVDNEKTTVSSFAAAGMLAPQSERLPKGQYLDLCLASKRMFPEFANLVESMAQEAGEEGRPYLIQDNDEHSTLEPWNIGYVASGGFLAPAFAGDNVATWAPPEDSKGTATWLDAIQVRELEPHLHPDVVGGWWFPEDASVDARRLTCSLRAACVGAGIDYKCGSSYQVSSLDLEEGNCKGLWLKSGKYINTKSILVANGAWMRTLLPVPLEPHKGQSLSLRMPKDRPPLLRRVLFAQDSYIVPKADGRIVIGATVEAGSFDPSVTPGGIMHILSYALQLVPALAELPLEETWAGLRPTTPDKGPILGATPWSNLFLAGGYWRNGVLLAPKTGELLANLLAGNDLTETDQAFLQAFSWDRFTSPEGGKKLAASARYAASMYPIHTRKSGVGVSASVGTELGSYSTAVSARDERQRDREALFGGGDDLLERAASIGREDGSAFSFGDEENGISSAAREVPAVSKVEEAVHEFSLQDKSASDGYSGAVDDDENSGLQSLYASIRENKSKQDVEMDEDKGEERPDPGFRIYHVDENTGEKREVPPYTAPEDFLESIKETSTKIADDDKNQASFDGYQTILDAAAKDSDIKETMRQARMRNRKEEEDENELFPFAKPDIYEKVVEETVGDLSSAYQQIRKQKEALQTELNEPTPDGRPDPGFRIYHVDEKTGESTEVPPYTSPGDFLSSIETENSNPVVPDANQDDFHEDKTYETAHSSYSETTYDGYQDIIQSNSAESRAAELEAMRKARQKNRFGEGAEID